MGKYSSKSGRPPMQKVICDECGKKCEVPFKPTGDKPVYCSDCFEKFGKKRFDRNSKGPGFGKRDFSKNNKRESGYRKREYGRESRNTEMYSAICDECGEKCEVPFRPSSGKPIFCNNCFQGKTSRNERRDERQSRGRSGYREKRPKEMFTAVCAECGKDCEVPFKPRSNKPVYCSDCFEKKDRVIENKGTNYEGKSKEMKQLRDQIDGLNKKIDMIMEMLEIMNQGKNKSKKKEKEESKPEEAKKPKKKEIKAKKEPKKKKTVKKKGKTKEVKKQGKKESKQKEE